MERNLTGLLEPREYHTNYPEEDDIVAGHEYICRIEVSVLRGILRPAEGLKRPECTGEPGIEGVLILSEVMSTALRAALRCLGPDHHLTAVLTVVGRDTVSPPELTGDTPVLDILKPVKIGLTVVLRNELELAGLDGLDRRLRHLLHTYEPLRLDHWLDRGTTAVVGTDIMLRRNDLHQQTEIGQILYHGLSCLIAVHAIILRSRAVDGRIIVQDRDLRQIVTLADLEVVRVVCRCDLYSTGSEGHIGMLIPDDRDLTIRKRKLHHLADHVLIARILRIDGDGGITEQGLRTGGCDLDLTGTIRERIEDMPEVTLLLLVVYLCITEGSMAYRTPVDDSGALVDVALLIQIDEGRLHSVRAALVHGEAKSFPVGTGTDLVELVDDSGLVLLLPLPGLLQEALTTERMLIDASLLQLIGDLHLRCDRRMITARLPQCFIALHTLPADQGILQGVIEGVAHVQLTGNIWWRHHDGKRLLVRVDLRMEIVALQPHVIDAVLNLLRVVLLCKFFHNHFLLLSIF